MNSPCICVVLQALKLFPDAYSFDHDQSKEMTASQWLAYCDRQKLLSGTRLTVAQATLIFVEVRLDATALHCDCDCDCDCDCATGGSCCPAPGSRWRRPHSSSWSCT